MLDAHANPSHHRRSTWISGSAARSPLSDALFAGLLVAGVALLFAFAPAGHWASPWEVGALLVAASVASSVRFEVGAGWSSPVQLAQVPLWLAVPAAWFPVFAAVALVAGQAIEMRVSGSPVSPLACLRAAEDSWHALGAAVVLAILGQPEAVVSALPILLAVLAGQFAVDLLYTLGHGHMAYRSPLRTLAVACLSVSAVDAALFPIGFLAAYAMDGEPLLALSLVPLIALFSEFAREREERILQSIELSGAYRGTAQLMATVLRHDDAYTGGEHTRGVVDLALDLGRELGLGSSTLRSLEFGALLHDIGKLQIPNEIINKPGKLTDDEWAIIKEHPEIGQRMLDTVGGALSDAGRIVRAHHERFDGTGYPDGLKRYEIPLEARIIAVCDSFSAMTTNRPYRGAMSGQAAVAELDRCTGTQFDPAVVQAMHAVLADRGQILTVTRPRPASGDGDAGQLVA